MNGSSDKNNFSDNSDEERFTKDDRDFNFLKNLIDYDRKGGRLSSYAIKREKGERVDDIIAEKERIKNFGLKQDIDLRKETLQKLFYFLSIETAIIFLFSFFQAVQWPAGFHLEEWSFKLLVTATISQITIMLLVAVKYLFPNKK